MFISTFGKSTVLFFIALTSPILLDLAAPVFAYSTEAPESVLPLQRPTGAASDAEARYRDRSTQIARVLWQNLEHGLDFAEIDAGAMKKGICLLKIAPRNFKFVLGSISDDDSQPKTLSEWGDQKNLVAAINASMYLPDGITSTGYMKNERQFNNQRIASRFGAFFVSGPRERDLPEAAIIEKDNPEWRRLIDKYDIVVQNYRMTNSQQKILWNPGGPEYAISAVAEDMDGNILFMHSREPVEAYQFARTVLSLPLHIKSMMYVEGGSQAGLLLRTPQVRREISGRNAASLLVTGNSSARLPNVIGVQRKMPD